MCQATLFMAVYRGLPQRPFGDGDWECHNPWSVAAYRACVRFLRQSYEDGHIQNLRTLTEAFAAAQEALDEQIGQRGSFYAAGRRAGRRIRHCLNHGYAQEFIREFLHEWGWPNDPRVHDNDAFGVLECESTKSGETTWRIFESSSRSARGVSDVDYPTRSAAIEAARGVVATRLAERDGAPKKPARERPPTRPTIDGEPRRDGPQWRSGDIDPAEYRRILRFRGVEFGNWMSQTERQGALNASFDAMHDLTDLLGLPPSFASLGGRLGIAFGSRGGGIGSGAAHFEPGRWILHFTRTQGAGALAHEFGHALDYYMGGLLIPGLQLCLARDIAGYDASFWHGRTRPAILDAVGPAIDVLNEALMGRAGRPTDFRRQGWMLDRGRSRDYWGSPTELFARAFEAWVCDSLTERGQANDYLCYGVDENIGGRWNMRHEPYPRGDERRQINGAFTRLMADAAAFWLAGRSPGR